MSIDTADPPTTTLIAECKVSNQKKTIETMSASDPRLPEALRLLRHMRQNASAARLVDVLRTFSP